MLTIPVQVDELDETLHDLYAASDIVMNPESKSEYGVQDFNDAVWYIENCIDTDGNFRPLTLALAHGSDYLGKFVVEPYEGAAAWITYDSQGTRRGEPCETSEDEQHIPHILRAALIAEEWEPYDE